MRELLEKCSVPNTDVIGKRGIDDDARGDQHGERCAADFANGFIGIELIFRAVQEGEEAPIVSFELAIWVSRLKQGEEVQHLLSWHLHRRWSMGGYLDVHEDDCR